MASSIASSSALVVKAALSALLEDSDFSMKTTRMELAKEGALRLLQMSDEGQEKFEEFAMKLNSKLGALATPSNNKRISTLWKGFHSARLEEVRSVWKGVFAGIEGDKYTHDPLLWEYVNDILFEEHIKVKFHVEQEDVEVPELTSDDLNALRYAAGYVICKLLKKYKEAKCKHPNKQDFVVCLTSMEVKEGSEGESYLDFTKKWINAVNRGGLFRIDDGVFTFFYQIEVLVKIFLTKIFAEHSQYEKGEIISEVVSDNDVQFHWSMLAIDLDEEVGEEVDNSWFFNGRPFC